MYLWLILSLCPRQFSVRRSLLSNLADQVQVYKLADWLEKRMRQKDPAGCRPGERCSPGAQRCPDYRDASLTQAATSLSPFPSSRASGSLSLSSTSVQPGLKLLRKLISFEKELQEGLQSGARKGQEKTARVSDRGHTIEKGAVIRPINQKEKY